MSSVANVNTNFFPRSNENNSAITLAAAVAAGATTVALNGASANYSDGDVVVFTVDPTNGTLSQDFTGVMSGGNVINVVWTRGNNQTHSAGATVVDNVTSTHFNLLSKGIQQAHNQNGTLRTNAVNSTNQIASNVINTTNIVDGAVTGAKIATGAVASAQIADNSVTGNDINFSTVTAMPTSLKFVNQSVGYNLQVNLSRIGNTVFWNMDSTTANGVPQSDSTPLGETIPIGYRPYTGTIGTPVGLVTVGPKSSFGWFVSSDGSMNFTNNTVTSGAIRVHSTGSWATGDAWPT